MRSRSRTSFPAGAGTAPHASLTPATAAAKAGNSTGCRPTASAMSGSYGSSTSTASFDAKCRKKVISDTPARPAIAAAVVAS